MGSDPFVPVHDRIPASREAVLRMLQAGQPESTEIMLREERKEIQRAEGLFRGPGAGPEGCLFRGKN